MKIQTYLSPKQKSKQFNLYGKQTKAKFNFDYN